MNRPAVFRNIQSSGPWRRPVAGELAPPVPEHVHRLGVEVDAAPAGPGLDSELDGPACDVLDRAGDRQPIVAPVEVGPLESCDFAAAHAREGGEVERRVEAV